MVRSAVKNHHSLLSHPYSRIDATVIVGVSTLSIPRTPILSILHFDVVIVDEAGQIYQPATLGAIIAAESYVLVGDHEQLPLVQNQVADQGGK